MLMAAPIANEGTFSSGTPVPLFQVRGRAFVSSTDTFSYDVGSDGKQFLVNRYLKPDHPSPLTIVLNSHGGGTEIAAMQRVASDRSWRSPSSAS